VLHQLASMSCLIFFSLLAGEHIMLIFCLSSGERVRNPLWPRLLLL
jgi:hypothetical protein